MVALLAASVLFSGRAAAKETIHYDFEETLAPWAGQTDGPSSAFSFERRTGDNGCADKGNAYANLKMGADAFPAAAWMISGYDTGNAGTPRNELVNITLAARDTGNCSTCIPLIYVGAAKPQNGDSFKKLVPTVTDPPVPGSWTNYEFKTDVYTADMVYVAIGWKFGPPALPPSPSFGTQMRNDYLYDKIHSERPSPAGSFGFDCVSLTIYPAP